MGERFDYASAHRELRELQASAAQVLARTTASGDVFKPLPWAGCHHVLSAAVMQCKCKLGNPAA